MQRIEREREVPQRRHEVAPTGSDVIRATGPSRLHFRCPELESRSQCDVSQRPREGSRIALGATSRSDHVRSLAFSVDQSDFSQRPREVTRVFCRSERRLAATTWFIDPVKAKNRAWERGSAATPRGRSSWERLDQSDSAKSFAFLFMGLENRSRSDVSQRPREVARIFCRSERRLQSDVFRATPTSRSSFRRHTT
ncbi:hypothetical protein F2Q69_00020689 [Brassica cretica]|uniref:Uncharacterized protein n=1 Tax=Brassica cretica TaxID=69181 RepID=A0A8S9Q710_BRACR|nr:hypothetical protein F2Q69_00020689 [Brassica cretica]